MSYAAPYMSYAAPYISFAAPYLSYAAPYLKICHCILPSPTNSGRWLTEKGEITEDDLPGPSRFRLVLSRNWPNPGKSSSGVTKSRKMTYRGLANSGLWQARIGLSLVSHLAKFEKRIWWSQLPKVIFRGQAIPACRKPELVGPGKSSSGGWKIAESDFGWTKSSQKSLSRWKGFYAPLVRWYH